MRKNDDLSIVCWALLVFQVVFRSHQFAGYLCGGLADSKGREKKGAHTVLRFVGPLLSVFLVFEETLIDQTSSVKLMAVVIECAQPFVRLRRKAVVVS